MEHLRNPLFLAGSIALFLTSGCSISRTSSEESIVWVDDRTTLFNGKLKNNSSIHFIHVSGQPDSIAFAHSDATLLLLIEDNIVFTDWAMLTFKQLPSKETTGYIAAELSRVLYESKKSASPNTEDTSIWRSDVKLKLFDLND